MSTVKQTDNVAGGDIVGGDKHVHVHGAHRTRIGELNERFKKECENPEGLNHLLSALEHYWGQSTNPDVRGLNAKLTESDRKDLIHDGEMLKEKVAKKILQYQTFRSAQDIFVWVFAEVFTRFIFEIRPRIQSGADRATIDQLIHEKIIEPVFAGLEENVLSLYKDEIAGFLFYLGGNCHIRWDAC